MVTLSEQRESILGQTAVTRDRFALLSLGWAYYLAVSNTNAHDTYLNNQLRPIYSDVSIVEIDAQTDM